MTTVNIPSEAVMICLLDKCYFTLVTFLARHIADRIFARFFFENWRSSNSLNFGMKIWHVTSAKLAKDERHEFSIWKQLNEAHKEQNAFDVF